MLDGEPCPSPKRGLSPSPIFGQCLLWPNGWMDQDGTWRVDGPWFRPHCARWGPSSPPQKGGQRPPILGPFYCGQTARCIKTSLRMDLGLSPGVTDGDAAPSTKRGGAPQFSDHVYCGQTAACIKMPLGTEIGLSLRPTRHCVRWETNSSSLRAQSPNFRPVSVVAKRLDGLRCHLVWR